MELNDIVKLADAGFSKEDIIKMVSDPEPAAPATDPEPAAPVAEPEPAAPDLESFIDKLSEKVAERLKLAEPEPASDPEPAADPEGEPALNQILDLLHKGFVQTSNQPEQPTVDDILSDIIDPAPPKI